MTARPERPCLTCGKRTAAIRQRCRGCLAASLAKEPTDDHALTGGRWVVRPNSFGIRVWVPDEDHAQPTPGTCIDCGEPASTKRRLRCDPCRKEAHRRDKARHMRKVRSKAA